MQIDRSNYEIWFIDWQDGNLNGQQVEELKLFLNENPELREELNDLTAFNLVPSNISFPKKDQLKKLISDITASQFEYLCTAYLENDLSGSQQAELKEIVDIYPDKKKIFDLIQKTRLSPSTIRYKHKSLLLKRTTIQKVIRLSVIGLSAAAAIVLILLTYSVLPGISSLKITRSYKNAMNDNTSQRILSVVEPVKPVADSLSVPVEQKREKRFSNDHKEDHPRTNTDLITANSHDSSAIKTYNQDITVNKVPYYIKIDLKKEVISNTLIASGTIIRTPEINDERSKISRFISKTFREKLLKEKTQTDRPLKGYEIAGLGVSGLNKLFGWEMALNEKNDENGQVKSVMFSSKMLKFSAPVKKSEPLP